MKRLNLRIMESCAIDMYYNFEEIITEFLVKFFVSSFPGQLSCNNHPVLPSSIPHSQEMILDLKQRPHYHQNHDSPFVLYHYSELVYLERIVQGLCQITYRCLLDTLYIYCKKYYTLFGYNHRRSILLNRGIAKYVRPMTSIMVISMSVSNGRCPK
jgi:hypothetical protein